MDENASEGSVLSAIQDIAVYALGQDDTKEWEQALNLIESICRYGDLVWSPEEEAKYKGAAD